MPKQRGQGNERTYAKAVEHAQRYRRLGNCFSEIDDAHIARVTTGPGYRTNTGGCIVSHDEGEANANLIIAAPDLLAACLAGNDDGMDGALLSIAGKILFNLAHTGGFAERYCSNIAVRLYGKQAMIREALEKVQL